MIIYIDDSAHGRVRVTAKRPHHSSDIPPGEPGVCRQPPDHIIILLPIVLS